MDWECRFVSTSCKVKWTQIGHFRKRAPRTQNKTDLKRKTTHSPPGTEPSTSRGYHLMRMRLWVWHCLESVSFMRIIHCNLMCFIFFRCNQITAHSWAHWSSHCCYGYCPHPASSAFCRRRDGCAARQREVACRAPGSAPHFGGGCEHARTPNCLWCHPAPGSCHTGYWWWCRSRLLPAGRRARGGGASLLRHWSRWLGIRKCPRRMTWRGRGGACGRCYFPRPSLPGNGWQQKAWWGEENHAARYPKCNLKVSIKWIEIYCIL